MLPDFPETKEKYFQLWNQFVLSRYQHYRDPFFSEVSSYRHHEGRQWGIIREDQSASVSEYEKISAHLEMSDEELIVLTPEKLAHKFDQVAMEMADQEGKTLYANLIKTLEEQNRVSNTGQPFGPDTFLEALKQIEVDFDDSGNLTSLALIVSPKLAEHIKQNQQTWENDPEFKKRHDAIIAEKREKWRAREANRRLVD